MRCVAIAWYRAEAKTLEPASADLLADHGFSKTSAPISDSNFESAKTSKIKFHALVRGTPLTLPHSSGSEGQSLSA